MNIENNYAGAGAVQIINGKPEEKVQPSFFATSSYESYKNVNPKREPETCLWFLHHPTFQAWKKKSCNDILWLSADPGCGKSVLSRALIDEKLVSVEPVTLCYFFFKDNPEQNNATKALCALLHKLLCELRKKETYDEIVQKHIQPAWTNYKDTLKTNFEELWRIFLSVATDPSVGDIVCILDALDECHMADRKKIIDCLNMLYCDIHTRTERGSMLKFLVTSRPYREIEDRFFALTRKFPTIRLAGENESKNISCEISIVMRSELDQIAESCGLKDDVKRFLVDEMEKIQNRTYLWLHLTLDEIRNSSGHSQKKMEKAVRIIPETVEEAYEKILGRCKEKEATRVLHIILAAQRPLTLDEIDIALGIRTDPAPQCLVLADLDCEGENIRKMIRKVCGLFIVVEDKRVFLIHQTAREFLLRKGAEAIVPGMWKQSIEIRDAHRTLSDICVSYLSSPDVYNKRDQFLGYSSAYWYDHVQQAYNSDIEWIQRTIKLLDIGGFIGSFEILFRIGHIGNYGTLTTTLYWAIILDLADGVRYLLQDFLDNRDQVTPADKIVGHDVGADHHGKELAVHPLDRPRVDAQITDILAAAIEHNRKKVMTLLLNEQKTKVFITKEMAVVIIEEFDYETISLLFRQRPDIQVTTEVIEAAARNLEYGYDVMKFLFKYRKSEVQVTEEILQIAADEGSYGMDFIKIVFNFMGSDVPFTEEVFKKALTNEDFADEDLKLLLEWWGAGVTFTTKTVELMVEFHLFDVLEIVLDQHRTDFGITEDIVKSALTNFDNGNKMMGLILNRRRAVGIPLAAKAVELIVRYFDEKIVGILFNQDGSDLRVTEEVVQAAATNRERSRQVMAILHNRRRDEVMEAFEQLSGKDARFKKDSNYFYVDHWGCQNYYIR